MQIRKGWLIAASLLAVGTADAQILLNTGIGNTTTFRGSSQGPSQRVSVASNTAISQFGFWVGTTGAVDLKFLIYSGDGLNVLFSQIQTVTNSPTNTLVLTTPALFNLLGGQTYDFAVIGNGEYNVSFFAPTFNLTQNGLTLVNPNRNYGPFSNPVLLGDAGATIALQIRGAAVVPEPGTYALLASGLVILGVVSRRRVRRA